MFNSHKVRVLDFCMRLQSVPRSGATIIILSTTDLFAICTHYAIIE